MQLQILFHDFKIFLLKAVSITYVRQHIIGDSNTTVPVHIYWYSTLNV